jgi:hypothetical protein
MKVIVKCYKCGKDTPVLLLHTTVDKIDSSNIRLLCSECTGRKKNNKNNKYNLKKRHAGETIVNGETVTEGIENEED